MPRTKDRPKWSFPTVSLCPRCGGHQTRATSTQGRIQYRQCQAPVCRRRYHVTGTAVPKATPVKKSDDSPAAHEKDSLQDYKESRSARRSRG